LQERDDKLKAELQTVVEIGSPGIIVGDFREKARQIADESYLQLKSAATDAWICRERSLRFRNLGMILHHRSRLTRTAAMRFIDRI